MKNLQLIKKVLYLHTENIHRGMEQLAARWAHNPKVGGSSPPPATQKGLDLFWTFIIICLWNISFYLS